MNSMVEKEARRVLTSVFEPNLVRVKVKTSWNYGMCLPDSNGDEEEEAVFSVLTFGDNYAIDKAVTKEVDIENGRSKVSISDLNEYKRLLVKRSLLSWTLDIPIERDGYGWMTPESYARVSSIPAPLLNAFVGGMEESVEITDDEEAMVNRQCAILFSKTGRGVADACEAVNLFCTLGNYWEKFGIDKNKLPLIPYREFLMLKLMISKEGEANRVQTKHKPSSTRIAGAGGRTRPSKGVTM